MGMGLRTRSSGSDIDDVSFAGGTIDQIRVYNYARSPAQIAWDYNRGKPVSHWKFDDCQGVVANDSSGLGNTGTIIIGADGSQNNLGTCSLGTSAAWTNGQTGKLNSAINLDGTDDYVSVGVGISNTNSLSLWLKPSTTAPVILDLDGGTHYLIGSGSTLSASGFSSPTIYVNGLPSSSFTPNVWNHIAVTTTTAFNSTSITLGKYSTTYFSGLLDDVKIFNYPLTSSQIKTLYNDGGISFN